MNNPNILIKRSLIANTFSDADGSFLTGAESVTGQTSIPIQNTYDFNLGIGEQVTLEQGYLAHNLTIRNSANSGTVEEIIRNIEIKSIEDVRVLAYVPNSGYYKYEFKNDCIFVGKIQWVSYDTHSNPDTSSWSYYSFSASAKLYTASDGNIETFCEGNYSGINSTDTFMRYCSAGDYIILKYSGPAATSGSNTSLTGTCLYLG